MKNRSLNKEDFTDDSKDAGEIGAGQSITALYELSIQMCKTKNLSTI